MLIEFDKKNSIRVKILMYTTRLFIFPLYSEKYVFFFKYFATNVPRKNWTCIKVMNNDKIPTNKKFNGISTINKNIVIYDVFATQKKTETKSNIVCVCVFFYIFNCICWTFVHSCNDCIDIQLQFWFFPFQLNTI